jgi:DNA-3-methyladenine glycosylase
LQKKLTIDFYQRKNVVKIARELLGKALFTNIDGVVTGGIIVETEAYSWKEKGCHAYNARKTERNAIMFEEGGHTYVYLCYGMHYLFNVVTNVKGVADAVLIRALEPISGIPEMTLRRGRISNPYQLTSGPGKLSKALGIQKNMNAKSLLENDIWIEEISTTRSTRGKIVASPRIGIDYAGDDAQLPWRFHLKDNRWVSKSS